MAHKFLTLAPNDDRQRLLGIDVGSVPNAHPAKAVVVTSEVDRLVVFSRKNNGHWSSTTRHHNKIVATAARPQDVSSFNWSIRAGVAVGKAFVAVVSKRPYTDDESGTIFVDLFEWDDDGTLKPRTARPIPIPIEALRIRGVGSREVGFRAVGFDVRAFWEGNNLQVVVQLIDDNSQPQLCVLSADVTAMGHPDDHSQWEWDITVLDEGGYNFDVRVTGKAMTVVHRQKPHALEVELPITGLAGGFSFFLSLHSDSTPLEDLTGEQFRYTPLRVIRYDFSTRMTEAIAELPGVEHAQIQTLDPLRVTGDQMRSGVLRLRRVGSMHNPQFLLQLQVQLAYRVLIAEGSSGWRITSMYRHHADTPVQLEPIAASLWLPAITGQTLRAASLMNPYPMWLVEEQSEPRKPQELAFIHEQRSLGGLAVTRFRVSLGPSGDPTVTTIGYGVWDIGRIQLRGPTAQDRVNQNEVLQFGPRQRPGPYPHPDGYSVAEWDRMVNTLGGLLVADQVTPRMFFAYSDMGDGGGRVFHESDVLPIETPSAPGAKRLLPAAVTGPGAAAGTAWVEIAADDFVSAGLPGYNAPPVPFVVSNGERGLFPSIGGRPQAGLDALPWLADFAELSFFDEDADPNVPTTLDQQAADAMDDAIRSLTLSPTELSRFPPGAGPFDIEVTIEPSQPQTGATATLVASAPSLPDGWVVFEWHFSDDGSTASGSLVSRVFPVQGSVKVTVTATAQNGAVSVCSKCITVSPSLWESLWSLHEGVGGPALPRSSCTPPEPPVPPEFAIGACTVSLPKHIVDFDARPDGTRNSVTVTPRNTQDLQVRFDAGSGASQGFVIGKAGISITLQDIQLFGDVASIAKLNSLALRLVHTRSFTASVQTSDQRANSPLHGGLARNPGEETCDARNATLPAALATKPSPIPGRTAIEQLDVSISLTDGARKIGYLLALVIGFGLAALGFALLFAIAMAAIVLMGPAGIALMASLLIAGTVNAVATLLVSLLLGWLVIKVLGDLIINAIGAPLVRQNIESRLPAIHNTLEGAGLLEFAGEGLAESTAIKAIDQAISDGVDTSPPNMDGRDRFRPQFFETVFVGDGICRVLVRA